MKKKDLDDVVESPPAKDNADDDTEGKETPDLETKLEQLKRERSGQDKKNRELLQENQALKQQLEERGEVPPDQAQRLAEIAGELKAYRRNLESKETALNTAIEKKININLALRNSDNLEDLINELEDMQMDRTRLVWAGSKSPDGVGYPQVSELSPKEMLRIPQRLWDRLGGAK